MKHTVALVTLALALVPSAANAAVSPEEEAKFLGKILKPIPDTEWETIASQHLSERYEVVRGDTLFDISKRLFGDGKYWPKVWALNNPGIANPHVLRPGIIIAFMPGTGSSLPSVSLSQEDSSVTDTASTGLSTSSFKKVADDPAPLDDRWHTKRSEDWKKLPRQSWETIAVQLPSEVDPQGFDRRSKIFFKPLNDFDLEAQVTSDLIEPAGYVYGSMTDAAEMMIGDVLYAKSDSGLKIGETYAVTTDPWVLDQGGDNEGFSYQILGRIVINGVRDGVYICYVSQARLPIPRNAILIPLPPRAAVTDPIPGPTSVEGVVFFDRRFATSLQAQHKQIFVNRGSEDGVQPGMIFRAYNDKDPITDEAIFEEGFIPVADIMILQTSPRFSTGLLLSTPQLLAEETEVKLLTDVSDVGKPFVLGTHPETDELEKIDPGSDLSGTEERELKQLERHGELPPPPAPAEGDELPPPPAPAEGDELPPPPAPAEGDELPPPPAPASGGDELPPPPTEAEPLSEPPPTVPSLEPETGGFPSSDAPVEDFPPPPPPSP